MMHFDFQVGDLDSAVEAVALGASVAAEQPQENVGPRPGRTPVLPVPRGGLTGPAFASATILAWLTRATPSSPMSAGWSSAAPTGPASSPS